MYGAFQSTDRKGYNLHKIAWNQEEKYSLLLQGYKPYNKNAAIPKPTPLGKKAIIFQEVQKNKEMFSRIRANPIPKVVSSSDPILSTSMSARNTRRAISDKKFNFMGIGKGVPKSKYIPSPVRKGGVLGRLLTGAISVLGVSIMKGATNPGRFQVYGRVMQDLAVGKNMLNNTRVGLASGTSKINEMGHTMGLSNALSRSRHGRT